MKSSFSSPFVLKTLESYAWSSEIAGVMSRFAAAAREAGSRMPIVNSATNVTLTESALADETRLVRIAPFLSIVISRHHDRVAGTEDIVPLPAIVDHLIVVDLPDLLPPGDVPDQPFFFFFWARWDNDTPPKGR